MAKTISQRISLEGSEDIRKKLEELGKTGEAAFKQIQDAAKKPITDPAQVERTRQAIANLGSASTQLGQQFNALTQSTQQFGQAGAQATGQVTAGLNQTTQAAVQTGTALQRSAQTAAVAGQQVGVGLISSANAFRLAALGIVAAITAVTSALTKGAVETATKISDAAEKIKVTTAELVNFRKAADAAGVSTDTLEKALEKAGGVLDKAKGGVAQLGQGVSELSTFSNNGTVTILRFNDAASKLTSSANTAATELAKLGISTRAAAMPEGIARFRQLADEISKIPDKTKQAAAGVAIFGKDWEKVVEILRTGQRDIDNTTRSLDQAGKANRQMSAEAVEAATKLGETWKDLEEAIRATRDVIGSVFVGGAQLRADWLIKLVDGSRELLRTWFALAEAKRDAFLASLGETPAEKAFKIMIALGRQLAGIWRDILVPAGRQLMFIVAQISDSFEGVSKSQVAAFFVTAAVAAVGLSLALKGIQLVLAPLALLFSGFGPVLIAAGVAAFVFWDKIVAGAQQAAELVPNSLALIAQSFQRLFAGDFAGFWAQFSEGAIAAFQTITQAVQQVPWVQTLLAGLQQIATDGPAAIQFVIDAIIALGRAASFVADLINRIFGTQLTGTDIALIAIVAQLTGGLAALASVAVIVGAAIGALAALFGGPVTIAILAVGAALAALIAYWPEIVAGAQAAVQAVINFSNALDAAVWEAFKNAGIAAMDAITGAINAVIGTISSLIGAIGDAINSLLKLLGLGQQVGQPGGSGATGSWARGGVIGGRGTGTSDSNLAWVSRGEHIMPARAVRQPGVLAFLEALRRSGGNLTRVLDRMGHFATGGLVTMPAFAGGGLNSMSNVTIQFPGLPDIGGLRAAPSAVEQLHRAAVMAQVRSGGRKPSRYS